MDQEQRGRDACLLATGRARRPILGGIVAVIVALVLGIGGGTESRAAGTTTVTEVECGILLTGILPEGRVLVAQGRLIITEGGTATLICRGELAPALAPDSALLITDVACALGDGGTVGESHTQIAPSGRVLLVCHNNPGSEPLPPSEGD